MLVYSKDAYVAPDPDMTAARRIGDIAKRVNPTWDPGEDHDDVSREPRVLQEEQLPSSSNTAAHVQEPRRTLSESEE